MRHMKEQHDADAGEQRARQHQWPTPTPASAESIRDGADDGIDKHDQHFRNEYRGAGQTGRNRQIVGHENQQQ